MSGFGGYYCTFKLKLVEELRAGYPPNCGTEGPVTGEVAGLARVALSVNVPTGVVLELVEELLPLQALSEKTPARSNSSIGKCRIRDRLRRPKIKNMLNRRVNRAGIPNLPTPADVTRPPAVAAVVISEKVAVYVSAPVLVKVGIVPVTRLTPGGQTSQIQRTEADL